MTSSLSLLQSALKSLGADGLCNPGEECGCGLSDLAPCDCIYLDECVAAKFVQPKPGDAGYREDMPNGYSVPMEVA